MSKLKTKAKPKKKSTAKPAKAAAKKPGLKPVAPSTGYWLMKTEPSTYSIDDLKRDKSSLWTGVRNYVARNFMRDTMRVGDQVLIYHSSAEPPGAAGIATISKIDQVDPTAFDPKSSSYDEKSKKEAPSWKCAEVTYSAHLNHYLPLETMRKAPALSKMELLKPGQRLSIQPVQKSEFDFILTTAGGTK